MGDQSFTDVTARSGDRARPDPHVNWGDGFVDFDNDGWPDLYIVNGHLDENVHQYDQSAVYDAPDFVLRNTGRGTSRTSPAAVGDGLTLRLSGRGAAFGDLDNDGRQ